MSSPSPRVTRRQFLVKGISTTAALLLGRRCRSPVSLPSGSFVLSLWSGALTPTSIRVNARIDHDSDQVRLLVSELPDLDDPIYSAYGTADLATNNRMVSLPLTSLQPNTDYYYAIQADVLVDTGRLGRFHTPATGPHSFTFAFASCAETGSSHAVFATIRQLSPLFFIHMGDFHYSDIAANDPNLFRNAYNTVLASATQSALYQNIPIAYMWDDHDYGPNDSDKNSPSRHASRLTYQEYVPHYPLVAGTGDVPIYQAFTIGRVRFILTDTRSERDPASVPQDDPNKTIMGAAQKAWFKQEILAAQGVYPVIVWVSTSPWLADPPGSGVDNWNGFRAERRELADFFQANNIQNLFFISGDVHMIGIDDGRNNRYATNGGRGFPIMQAAALDRSGTYFTDNTYSEGQYPGRNHFGLMTITDDGGPQVQIEWSGREGSEEIVHLTLTSPPSPRLAVEPAEAITLAIQAGGPSTPSRSITIHNHGLGSMPWTITPDPPAPWLTITTAEGETPTESATPVTLTADPTSLDYGTYQTTLRVEAPTATDSPQLISLTLLYTNEPAALLPLVLYTLTNSD